MFTLTEAEKSDNTCLKKKWHNIIKQNQSAAGSMTPTVGYAVVGINMN